MTATHKNLSAALTAFQAEMPVVAKTKRANVGQYAYSYADLADVTEAAMPVLTKHGLAFAGSARHVEGGRYEVVGILSHESGEQREGALPIGGGNAQQYGSAITYMRRYLFGVMTGVVTDGDDDGALASAQKQQKQERRRAAATKPEPPAEAGEAMSENTRKAMFAAFNDRGITDKDTQLNGIANVIGRQVESRSDLSEAEGRRVVASLKGNA